MYTSIVVKLANQETHKQSTHYNVPNPFDSLSFH